MTAEENPVCNRERTRKVRSTANERELTRNIRVHSRLEFDLVGVIVPKPSITRRELSRNVRVHSRPFAVGISILLASPFPNWHYWTWSLAGTIRVHSRPFAVGNLDLVGVIVPKPSIIGPELSRNIRVHSRRFAVGIWILLASSFPNWHYWA
jgi:hypothetical protein